MRPHAFEFFSARETRDRAAPVAREPALPGRCRDWTSTTHSGTSDRALTRSPETTRREILRAFDQLKARESWRPRLGPAVSIQPRPCIRGHEIVLEPHLVSVEHPRGIRYVRGIDMVALVELAPAVRQVPDLYDAYVRQAGPVPLPDFLFARGDGGCAGVACVRMSRQGAEGAMPRRRSHR